MPEFVCTCCHRWLFHKSVHVYDETKYDMLNKTVNETFNKKYKHPMHVAVVKGSCCVHKLPIDYGGYSDFDNNELSGSNNDDLMYIQDVQQGSPHTLSISNMHNMPVPSPGFVCFTYGGKYIL